MRQEMHGLRRSSRSVWFWSRTEREASAGVRGVDRPTGNLPDDGAVGGKTADLANEGCS
jgi:hypothetical protein